METRMIAIKDLKFADYNPRKIDTRNFEKLRKSIKEFGFTVPNTVNKHPGRENIIVAGHMRTRAAEAEGLTEVPCFIVDLDIAKEKLLNVTLNNRNLMGQWDDQLLAELVVGLNTDGADVSLMGFAEDELISIQEGVGPRGLPQGHDSLTCERCKQLRSQIEGHEKKQNHLVYERKIDQK